MADLRVVKLLVFINVLQSIVNGQAVYLSLGNRNISNNTEIPISDVTEALSSRLTCHTDLTECCRARDTGSEGMGEWRYPSGEVIPKEDAGESFYRVRDAPQLIRLSRRGDARTPTGSFCCVIPTTEGEMAICANIVLCSSLTPPSNGVITYSDPPPGSNRVATLSCNPGYSPSGIVSRTCQSLNSWSGSDFVCAEACLDVTPPTNGGVQYSGNSVKDARPVGSTVTYTCDNSERTCQLQQKWSGLPPPCAFPICQDLPEPSNGAVVYSDGTLNNRSLGVTAAYTCVLGFTLVGGGGVRSCQTDETWSGKPSTCNVTTCADVLNAPANGDLEYNSGSTDNRPIDSTATYSCDVGYTLTGEPNSICGINGSWSQPPECVAITCSDLTVSNGVVSYDSGLTNSRQINSTATYSCDIGYTLTGEPNRTCEVTGSWSASGSATACVAVNCSYLDSPNHGSVNVTRFTYNSTAVYQCDFGYLLEGAESRTCQASGSWSLFEPTCEPDWGVLLSQRITAETYVLVASLVSAFGVASLENPELQSSDSLMLISRVFGGVADLVNTSNITVEPQVVEGMVSCLNSLMQWQPGVITAELSSTIVQSHETTVSVLAEQTNLTVTLSEITLVAEMAETAVYQGFGDRADFRMVNASISLPSQLFQQITSGQPSVGVVYALYENPSLFPVTQKVTYDSSSRRTVMASPVIAAAVGRGTPFKDLYPPVVIELELFENEDDTLMEGSVSCVSWDFSSSSWVTDGCERVGPGESGSVKCLCTHLTNFAVLIDICSRLEDCKPDPRADKFLSVVSYVGVSVSCLGLLLTVLTLLASKELRKRDNTTHNVQLCIAIFCVLLVFVAGIEQTELYGGCVAVSVLIHYFSLVAVMWMGAEAVLMFQKLVIVFGEITTTYLLITSLVCWLAPFALIIPVVTVDMANGMDPGSDLIITRHNISENSTDPGFCFLKHPGVFFGAFLVPILIVTLFNFVIFIWVIVVVCRSTKGKLERANEKLKPKTAIRVMTSLVGVMFLFGLAWFFAAFTFTIADNHVMRMVFQALFVLCATFQGFFIFLFLCVGEKKARDAWKALILSPSKSKTYSTNSNGSYHLYLRHGTTKKTSSTLSKYSNKVSSPTLSQETLRINSPSSPFAPNMSSFSQDSRTQRASSPLSQQTQMSCLSQEPQRASSPLSQHTQSNNTTSSSSPSQVTPGVCTSSLSQDTHTSLKTPDLPDLHESITEEC